MMGANGSILRGGAWQQNIFMIFHLKTLAAPKFSTDLKKAQTSLFDVIGTQCEKYISKELEFEISERRFSSTR